MKQYCVTLPVAGSVLVFVEADDEEGAIKAALKHADFRVTGGEGTEPGEEWEALRAINRGNVCFAPCWEASVEEDE